MIHDYQENHSHQSRITNQESRIAIASVLSRSMTRLTDEQIQEQVRGLEGWTREGNAIRKQFTFAGFPEAVGFVNRLVPEAERADHHPDITINYRRVTLSYSTHSEGGLTLKDIDGARMADRAARARA